MNSVHETAFVLKDLHVNGKQIWTVEFPTEAWTFDPLLFVEVFSSVSFKNEI